ncbi:MAG TPA: nicotinate-nucleotide adenylyltransferase [Candidatus Deferrimicrobiaceae bacterium]
MNAPETARPRIALFGGTFDPFHNGHLRMAIEVKELFGLPEIVLLPAHKPPHKPGRPVSDAASRLAMTRAAVDGLPGFAVSDIELRREGPSYTVDTVHAFRDANPGADILFVLGADSFAEIGSWHRSDALLAACDFIVLPRPGIAPGELLPPGVRVELEEPHCYSWTGASYRLPGGKRAYCPSVPGLDIASSAVRDKVRSGRCIRGLVPYTVERHIVDHRLYLD